MRIFVHHFRCLLVTTLRIVGYIISAAAYCFSLGMVCLFVYLTTEIYGVTGLLIGISGFCALIVALFVAVFTLIWISDYDCEAKP